MEDAITKRRIRAATVKYRKELSGTHATGSVTIVPRIVASMDQYVKGSTVVRKNVLLCSTNAAMTRISDRPVMTRKQPPV
jgi:hypothetical protein